MDAGVLINNAALKAIAESHLKNAEDPDGLFGLKTWQKKELGPEIKTLLGGL